MRKWNTLCDGRDIRDYISDAFQKYRDFLIKNPNYYIPFELQELVYAIQDWDSMVGGFTATEYSYLEKQWGFTKHDIELIVAAD